MTKPLANLKPLRDEMKRRGWVVTCFPFNFKGKQYFVLPQRYTESKPAPEMMLMELTFADRSDLTRTLVTPANSSRVAAGVKEVREYFGEEWSNNLKEFMEGFHESLGAVIPANVPHHLTEEESLAVLPMLSRGDSEDPRRVFCTSLRRNGLKANGEPKRRSEFNSQKAEMCRPALFAAMKDDTNVSFCFSLDPAEEKTDADILNQFAARQ